jgi:hypothetical protein
LAQTQATFTLENNYNSLVCKSCKKKLQIMSQTAIVCNIFATPIYDGSPLAGFPTPRQAAMGNDGFAKVAIYCKNNITTGHLQRFSWSFSTVLIHWRATMDNDEGTLSPTISGRNCLSGRELICVW